MYEHSGDFFLRSVYLRHGGNFFVFLSQENGLSDVENWPSLGSGVNPIEVSILSVFMGKGSSREGRKVGV